MVARTPSSMRSLRITASKRRVSKQRATATPSPWRRTTAKTAARKIAGSSSKEFEPDRRLARKIESSPWAIVEPRSADKLLWPALDRAAIIDGDGDATICTPLMLLSLTIRDVVLIDRLDLTFPSGLCVLTGETGAGKSILLDALGLALGKRAEAGLVRAGAKEAAVSAEFAVGR